jgi:protein-S-isoprenylcysteine O-methyltransferase Ste14
VGLILIFCIVLYSYIKKIEINESKKIYNLIVTKFKPLIEKHKSLIDSISIKISSLYVYLPIVLGILAPMLYLIIPLWYFSWFLFGTGDSLNSWALYYFLIPNNKIATWIVFEIIIFCIGVGIFLTGLISMILGKKRGDALIITGIYKYIRHPQIFGIIIFTFPCMLYIPGFEDLGIRMGDILSWSCFAFLQILSSFFEEKYLIKRFPAEFLEYYLNTGFFFPKLRKKKSDIPKSINYNKKFFFSIVFFIIYIIIFRNLMLIFSSSLILFR